MAIIGHALSKNQRQLTRFFVAQHGLCHWCESPMTLSYDPPRKDKVPNPRRATIDHLDDRFDPMRGKHGPQTIRRVAACWKCNNERSRERLRQLMRDNPLEVWQRAGTRPLFFIDVWESLFAV